MSFQLSKRYLNWLLCVSFFCSRLWCLGWLLLFNHWLLSLTFRWFIDFINDNKCWIVKVSRSMMEHYRLLAFFLLVLWWPWQILSFLNYSLTSGKLHFFRREIERLSTFRHALHHRVLARGLFSWRCQIDTTCLLLGGLGWHRPFLDWNCTRSR